MKKGIVIPCYNEANRLQLDRFQNFIDNNKSYILCFVNDGSKDETLEQLEDFRTGNESLVIIENLAINQGKAEAVRNGVQALLALSDVETIGYLDADLATGFEDYMRLENQIHTEGKNMVFGSRKMDDSEGIERSAFRKFASWVIGMMIKVLIGMPINDTQCGAKVFTRALARDIFDRSFLSRWLFDVEIFIRINNKFSKASMEVIKEVALDQWEEVEGSKITMRDTLKFPLALLEIGYDYKLKPIMANMSMTSRRSMPVVRPAA